MLNFGKSSIISRGVARSSPSTCHASSLRSSPVCASSKACSTPSLTSDASSASSPSSKHSKGPSNQQRKVSCRSTDYTAAPSDTGVLRLPARTELDANALLEVYGYPRNLQEMYLVGKVIGAGSFGVVRECVEIEGTHRKFAVKTVPKAPKRGVATPRYLLKLRTEVEIMQQLGFSLDAVALMDVFEDDTNVHLVMELCSGGALLERIETKRYSERYIATIVRSILRFISQCHAKGIIYRDVKPDNFLFLSSKEDAPLKATDFGLSIRHWPYEPKLSSRSGTPAYMAPELVMQNYDEKADIWSVGMLAYQMLTGRFPFWEDVRNQSLAEVWKAILGTPINWDAPELSQLSPRAISLLKLLLQRDPSQRPSAFEALQHPWISSEEMENNSPLQGSVVQRLQRFSTYGHLKQMVLKMIVDEVQEETMLKQHNWDLAIGGLQELFDQLDTDKSGGISFQELSSGLRAQGYVLSDSEIETLVLKIDSNNDGNIVLSEFMTTLIDWNQLQKDQGWQKYLDLAFNNLDIDGDGYISLEEIISRLPTASSSGTMSSRTQARAKQNGEFSRYEPDLERVAEAKLMLREADTNGDGKISREEFYALLKNSQAPDSLSFYDDRQSNGLLEKRRRVPA
ncbi:MAG: hypothetical protein WDW36_008448 [Sanguina aurantia]